MSVETTPVAASDKGSTGRRESRLSALVRLPHALGFLSFCYALVILTLLAYLPLGVWEQIILTWTAVVSIGFSARALRTGSRVSSVFCIGLSVALFFMTRSHAAALPNLGWLQAFVSTAAMLLILAGLAILLLSGLRLMTPATATLFFTTVAIALSLANAFIDTHATETPSIPIEEIAVRTKDRETRVSPPTQTQVEWLGQGAKNHPTLEYVYHPNITLKTIYPTNPRGYFHEEEVHGPLDMRTGFVFTHAGTQANIELPNERYGTTRVVPTELGTPQPWRITLQYHGIPLEKDKRYALSFTARSDAPRAMEYGILGKGQQEKNLGLHRKVKLNSEWRTFRDWFSANEDAPLATLMFLVGQDPSPVEVSNIAIVPVYANDSGYVDMRMFSMTPMDGGTLESPSEPGGTLRVNVARSDPKVPYAVQVVQDCFPVREGQQYNITFRARADKPRPLDLVMIQSRPEWKNAGLHLRMELTQDWRFFASEFRGSLNDPHARIVFNAAASQVPFEVADILFWPELSSPPLDPPKKRFTVEYTLNADGFRDRDHLTGKQDGTFRIACIGDSFTFGQGVHEPDTFVRRLENLLNADRPPNASIVDVMNFGICGYCTWQERLLYNEIASKYEPDLVLITMVHNDHLSPKEEAELGLNANQKPNEGQVLGNLQKAFENVMLMQSFDYTRCVEELKLLDADCKKRNAKLAVVIYRDGVGDNWLKLEKQVTEGLKGTGIPVLSLGELLTTWPFSTLKVHNVDGHPNEMSHAMAADAIVQFLRDNKLVPAH